MGDFSEVAGSKTDGLVTWDGQRWGVVPDAAKTSIYAAQQFDNQLFVSGTFGEEENHQIAVWQIKD